MSQSTSREEILSRADDDGNNENETEKEEKGETRDTRKRERQSHRTEKLLTASTLESPPFPCISRTIKRIFTKIKPAQEARLISLK